MMVSLAYIPAIHKLTGRKYRKGEAVVLPDVETEDEDILGNGVCKKKKCLIGVYKLIL
jgi:hypothetical protein